jgi:hypothetical protein
MNGIPPLTPAEKPMTICGTAWTVEPDSFESHFTRLQCCISTDTCKTKHGILWEEDHKGNTSSSDKNATSSQMYL